MKNIESMKIYIIADGNDMGSEEYYVKASNEDEACILMGDTYDFRGESKLTVQEFDSLPEVIFNNKLRVVRV